MRIFQPTVTGSNTTTGSLHISGPVYFYTLETSSTFHVLTYNTSSGQVFFTGSDSIGGKPDDPYNSIQFNYSGALSGSSNLLFINNIIYLTGSSLTSGSIILTGSMFVSGAISASFGIGSVGFYGTASWAQSSSFITGSGVYGPFGGNSILSASYASSSTFADTASFILNPYPINVTGSSLYSVAPAAGVPNIPENNNSIFFGQGAGFQTDLASNSNFLGYQVGYSANTASNSNFLGYQAGYSANTASNSNFLGYQAGYLSDFVTQSNFLGYQAGYQADNAYDSNFLGYRAGRLVKDAYNSNFIGYEAGSQQFSINTSSYNSNFIGYQVGKNTNNVYNSNFIGYNAGTSADFSPYSNFLGHQAGYGSTSASYSNFIGYSAGSNSDLSSRSIFIGYEAGSSAPTSSNSTFIGYRAGYTARNSNNSIFIGYEAGREVFNSSHSIFIGYQAGKEFDAGGVDYVGPNNIIIGTNVTLPISSQDSINIGGLIFATGSNSNVVPTTPTATPAGGKVGINIYPPLFNFHASGTISFPSLTSSSQVNVVMIDTSSGQLFYTSSNAIGGGNARPGGPNLSVQFNSASVFSGSSTIYINNDGPSSVEYDHLHLDNAWLTVRDSSNNNIILLTTDGLQLGDYGGFTSLDWSSRILYDTLATQSIQYDLRQLTYQNDLLSPAIDWGTVNQITISGSTFLKGLPESSSNYILTYDTSSNQVYFASSTTITTLPFPFSGSAIITGSLLVSGSGITGSLFGTSSWAINAITSSYPINVTGSSLYSVAPVAGIPSTVSNSIFFGNNAGFGAINAQYSNFLGYQAGYSADNASQSNFLGPQAGYNANSANNSNFFGSQSGYGASAAYNSNFLGPQAGYSANNARNSNFFGSQSGYDANNARNSNFLGELAGYEANNANDSNFLGYQAGFNALDAQYSNFLGSSAGENATNADNSNFLGYAAGHSAASASNSNFLGYQAGFDALNASESIFIGSNTGRNQDNAAYSILIGHRVGDKTNALGKLIGPNNIIIGTNVTFDTNRQDSLNIGGVIFGSELHNDTTLTFPFSGSAGGKIGINIVSPNYNLHVSGTVAFPSLTEESQVNVVVIDTSSGQLYYTASSAIGGGGSSTFNSTSSIIGNGLSSSYDINHGFNTRNLHITVYESGSSGETVYPDIRRPDDNTVRVVFTNPPSSSQYIIYISQ
jgi:hypothetical protein